MSSRPRPLVAVAIDRALSGCPPLPQPRNVRVAANAPRMRVVSLLWPALGRAPTPAGSPVEAAACLTGGMGQGQCLVLVQVTGCHRSMTALVSQCVNTKKTLNADLFRGDNRAANSMGAKLIVCYSML